MELQQPPKPATEINVLCARLDNEKKFLGAAQDLLDQAEKNANAYAQIMAEQAAIKASFAEVLENHQTISTSLTALKENLKTNKTITEEQQKELVIGILTVIKQKTFDLINASEKTIAKRLVSLGSSITESNEKLTEESNRAEKTFVNFRLFIENLQQNNVTLKQEITFIKRIGLGITSLALMYWLWIYTHKS